ncbi:MAG: Lrp/AsnC family transcriptional regulator [Eubacteriales bacterium]|nr:Lrp/AsnC family transcriptional regulator [Eubacteriales bacterium]
MDEIDIEILNLLQTNSRISLTEISEKIHMSISAISGRIRRLEQSGIILNYTALLDYTKLDKDLIAFVNIKFKKNTSVEVIEEFVNAQPDVYECYLQTGTFDCVLKIITKNTVTLKNLLSLFNDEITIEEMQTNIVLKPLKQNRFIKL